MITIISINFNTILKNVIHDNFFLMFWVNGKRIQSLAGSDEILTGNYSKHYKLLFVFEFW